QAAGVSADSPAATDDAMARYDHGNRITPQRLPDGAASPRLTDSPGQLTVRYNLSHGNIGGGLQYSAVKGNHPAEIDGKIKLRTGSGKIFSQFRYDPGQFFRRRDDIGPGLFVDFGDKSSLILGKRHLDEPLVCHRHPEIANRTLHPRVVNGRPLLR